jgi:hypothetical protein
MASEPMKIFTRTFDFLTWLLPATNSFPRAHRHTFTQRLLDAAFDFQERIEEGNARKGRARLAQLERADEALGKVRLYLRLAARWALAQRGPIRPRRASVQRDGQSAGRVVAADEGGGVAGGRCQLSGVKRERKGLTADTWHLHWSGAAGARLTGAVCCAAGRSPTMRTTCAVPPATGTTRTTGTTTSGFGCVRPHFPAALSMSVLWLRSRYGGSRLLDRRIRDQQRPCQNCWAV